MFRIMYKESMFRILYKESMFRILYKESMFRILYKESRVRSLVRSVIQQRREKTLPFMSRPEDILNVSIQSQVCILDSS